MIKKKANTSIKNLSRLKKIALLDNLKSIRKKGVMHVKRSFNNTIITLTDLNGNTKAYCSCGSVGFKGAKRSDKFAGIVTAEQIGRKSRRLGYRRIILRLNGVKKGRYSLLRSLRKCRLRIKEIKEVTSFAHNGCRPKKLRRV
jgi:small subunit ribosomal protein S11